jgi:hypothetical protein
MDQPPALLSSVTPDYPETVRDRGIEGVVWLEIAIAKSGNAEHDVRVTRIYSKPRSGCDYRSAPLALLTRPRPWRSCTSAAANPNAGHFAGQRRLKCIFPCVVVLSFTCKPARDLFRAVSVRVWAPDHFPSIHSSITSALNRSSRPIQKDRIPAVANQNGSVDLKMRHNSRGHILGRCHPAP